MKYFAIYDAGRTGIGLKLTNLVLFVAWLGGIYWCYDLYNNLGTNPVDGYDGLLAPLSHRMAWMSVVFFSFSSFLLGILFWGRIFVGKMQMSKDHQSLRIQTVGLFRNPQIDISLDDLLSVELRSLKGESRTQDYLRLRLRDRKWSLWMIYPGNVIDPEAFARYIY